MDFPATANATRKPPLTYGAGVLGGEAPQLTLRSFSKLKQITALLVHFQGNKLGFFSGQMSETGKFETIETIINCRENVSKCFLFT